MKIRFQADADLNGVLVKATRRRESRIDFQTAVAAGLTGVSDPNVLALSATNGRILVTHDRKTMPRHFADFIATNISPGVIIVPQSLRLGLAIEDLVLIWTATDAVEWTNRIVWLPI